jgi:uncharacterized protein (TIGR02265 family)
MVSALDLRAVKDELGVARRVSDAPVSAAVRGVWFSMASDFVQKLGRTEAIAFRSAVAPKRRLPFLSYPLREYIEELATAAALVDPRNPADGMRQIWRQATSSYVTTPFGRSLIRLLRPNPMRYLGWLADHRDHFCNYGLWTLVAHEDGHATMEMTKEYIWLEHAHRGGAEGLLLACGVEGTVEPELRGPYEGRLHVRWRPRPS